ncbi:DUF6364 family protein [Alkalimonas sp. MEB108]|uniref:DUF6364 family protein n=2 Tax=Alkalimonas cellulosilytica TaxID=3058395 RepID=A0ABU7J798_9GAMM|nr:DUF6364 family protein [Alkalimonas sp. MEB108]MEE2002284.1 DUF6364 family protein [Alkalimonas sp. MEB108]
MEQTSTKLTIRLPSQDVDFAKSYSQRHGITVTEMIDRYLRRLRALEQYTPSVELEQISGLVPEQVDARQLYRDHLLDKHSQ